MKTLILVRHAKSDRSDSSMPDIDRPLNARGHRDAPMMGAVLAASYRSGIHCVVTSPALRAATTCGYFLRELGNQVECFTEPRIYEAPVSQLVEVVQGLDDRFTHALLFGHNPGFSMLVEYLTGEWVDMPTCGIAVMESAVPHWAAMSRGVARLASFDYPKRYVS
ncbi:MAG: SixA phosphatase family protein [Flavobacteriales bacterium]|jgi:phosphohistidine phosphatase